MSSQAALWCFKPGSPGSNNVVSERTDATSEAAQPWLVCASCKQRVTTDSDRIKVRDHHEHTFMNPHAFAYHIGCFGAATGASPRGFATTEWTWFPGYGWQLAHCIKCGSHLGWRFQDGDHCFFGLVLNRLVRQAN